MNTDDQAQVSTETANRMSLFYAYPTPMLKTLSDATSKFVSEVYIYYVLFSNMITVSSH